MKNTENLTIEFYKNVVQKQGKLVAEQSTQIAMLKVLLELQMETLDAQTNYVLAPKLEYLSVN